jgi:hypothetical protein
MPIEPSQIFSYLVPPGKSAEEPSHVNGAAVPLRGKLFTMLKGVFDRSEEECNIAIAFKPDAPDRQANAMHTGLVGFVRRPTMASGRTLAERLRDHTTAKSGLGLLFFMSGSHRNDCKLVVSRFPAEEGILAEVRGRGLDVAFIEKIFLKRAHAYKAVLYRGTNPQEHFWDGLAIDKQTSERWDQLANYWIHGFLSSDFRTTSEAGTRRLAGALKEALDHAPTPEVKQEVISAATLAPGRDGHVVSITDFLVDLHLSDEAQRCILAQLPNQIVAEERFVMSRNEFQQNLSMRSLDLDTGVSVTGPADRFDQLVTREQLAGGPQQFELRTRGTIVAEKLKKGK